MKYKEEKFETKTFELINTLLFFRKYTNLHVNI